MNRMLKRCLHLGVLLALGAVVFTGSRASAITAPTPVSACTALASDTAYILTQNILNVSGDCFTVGENTSLDLGKHTIEGNNTGVGVSGDDAPNVVIVNGTISHFDTGIYMGGGGASFNLTVDNVNLNSNAEDGIESDSCCNTVTNVKSNNNGESGIDFFGEGCCSTFSNVNTSSNGETGLFAGCCTLAFGVTSNNNADGDGIELVNSASSVQGSTANGNAGDGIELTGEVNSVGWSTANGNGEDGIFAGTSCCSLVDHATANSNGGDGISAESCCNLVSNSVASQDLGDGIDLTSGDDNSIMRDTTVSNSVFGVDIECESTVVRLQSHGNACSDLCEFDSTCTNTNNLNKTSGCGC